MNEYISQDASPTHRECLSFVQRVEAGFARHVVNRPRASFPNFGLVVSGIDSEMKRHSISVSKKTLPSKKSLFLELVSEVGRVSAEEAMGYLAARKAIVGGAAAERDRHEVVDEISAAEHELERLRDSENVLLKSDLTLGFEVSGHGPHQQLRVAKQSETSILEVMNGGLECQTVARVGASSHTYASIAGGVMGGSRYEMAHSAAIESLADGNLQRADLVTMARALKSFGYVGLRVLPYEGFQLGPDIGDCGPSIDLRFISPADYRFSEPERVL